MLKSFNVYVYKTLPSRDIFYDSASLRQEKQSNKFRVTGVGVQGVYFVF